MSTRSILFRRLFNFIPDIGVQLNTAGYVRPFSAGNNWSRIRLGALLALTGNGTNNLAEAVFRMGLSSSKGSSMSAYQPDSQFIGTQLFANGTATYAANSGYPVFTGNGANLIRILGRTTATTVAGSTTFALSVANTPSSRMRRTPIILDITRPQGGAGLCTLTCYGMTAANASFDFRPDHLMQAIDNWGAATINGVAMTSLNTNATIPVSEVFGELDQFEMSWNHYQFPMEVYALGGSILLPGYYSDSFGGAIETFELETLIASPSRGSIGYQGTNVVKDELTGGTFFSGSAAWDGAGTFIGSSMGTGVYGYYGTSTNWPQEWFNQYQTGTYPSLSLDLGKGWTSAGTIISP